MISTELPFFSYMTKYFQASISPIFSSFIPSLAASSSWAAVGPCTLYRALSSRASSAAIRAASACAASASAFAISHFSPSIAVKNEKDGGKRLCKKKRTSNSRTIQKQDIAR